MSTTETTTPQPTDQTLVWFPLQNCPTGIDRVMTVAFEARPSTCGTSTGPGSFVLVEHFADGTSHTIDSFALAKSAVMAAADRAGWR